MTQVRAINTWIWPSSSWCAPPVETQVASIVPPGHFCLFRFPFSLFSSFFPSLLPLPAFPFLFVLPFFVCFLYRLLRLFFASLLSLVADSVILSRCYIPPALLARLQVCVLPLCVVLFIFLSYWFLVFYFSSLPCLFFGFDLDDVCFILSCFCGYCLCCCLLGVSVVTLNRYFYPSTSSAPRVRADSSS